MHKRWTILLFAALLSLSGCGQLRPPGAKEYLITHTVRPGDTLYSIAWHYGYDYREVAAWNRIGPPYRIYVGQELAIISPYRHEDRGAPPIHATAPSTRPHKPGTSAPSVKSSPRPARPVATPAPMSPTLPSSAQTTARPPPSRESTQHFAGSIGWRWPTSGKVVTAFSPGAGKQGIDIQGRTGQAIFAAAAGNVVYSGNGLLGYGNLVIIKHDETYLSAYGHNSKLLVKEGTKVKQGQKIAEMGQTSKTGSILHFQIRREGKPVDPMKFLPKR